MIKRDKIKSAIFNVLVVSVWLHGKYAYNYNRYQFSLYEDKFQNVNDIFLQQHDMLEYTNLCDWGFWWWWYWCFLCFISSGTDGPRTGLKNLSITCLFPGSRLLTSSWLGRLYKGLCWRSVVLLSCILSSEDQVFLFKRMSSNITIPKNSVDSDNQKKIQ